MRQSGPSPNVQRAHSSKHNVSPNNHSHENGPKVADIMSNVLIDLPDHIRCVRHRADLQFTSSVIAAICLTKTKSLYPVLVPSQSWSCPMRPVTMILNLKLIMKVTMMLQMLNNVILSIHLLHVILHLILVLILHVLVHVAPSLLLRFTALMSNNHHICMSIVIMSHFALRSTQVHDAVRHVHVYEFQQWLRRPPLYCICICSIFL